jgi:hypothetical protein
LATQGIALLSTIEYHMAHYTLDDASLSELQFDIMYDCIHVSLMLVTRVLYGPLMLYGVSNFLVYGLYICV